MWTAKWLTGAAVLAVALLGFGAVAVGYHAADKEPAANRAKGDADAIQGTWQVVRLEAAGEEEDDDEAKRMKKATWVFKAGKLRVKKGGEDGEAAYKLHPDKKPKAIDVTPQNGPPLEKGMLIKAVYELKGDELKVCISHPPGVDRPDSLNTKGTRNLLIVLRREKAKK